MTVPVPFEWLEGWDQPLLGPGPFRVIGIDLGTTNSTITEVVWQPGGGPPISEVIDVPQPTRLGEIVQDIVPSVVARLGSDVLVGEGAHRLRGDEALRRNNDIFWSTKNEIGTSRIYAQAPEGFKTPRDIATHILKFLHQAALENAGGEIDRVVVTVPASFQWTQRQDTLQAGLGAGLEVGAGDLLDEPVAAFLDFLVTNGSDALPEGRDALNTLVLDFGGGTCDVALLNVARLAGGEVRVAREAVSRFHRIGGSDIDDQIAVDVLLPELMRQSDRSARQYSYTQKRDHILPMLVTIADNLKEKLSDRIVQLQGLGTYDPDDTGLSVSLPGRSTVPTGKGGEHLMLDSPSLDLAQLRHSTRRFVSSSLLTPMRGEYTLVTSVFAPVSDVLDRRGLDPDDIDVVLLVGGSSLLPTFFEAVEAYFPGASILRYRERRDALRCVGRGAAYHALLLAAYGTSPLRPTTGDALSLRVQGGTMEIVPRNAYLPYPAEGASAEFDQLRLPKGDGAGPATLRLELATGTNDGIFTDERVLHSHTVEVPPPATGGDPITLKVSVDENQVVSLIATIHSGPHRQTVELELDNPSSVVENPGTDEERLLELEELVRQVPSNRRPEIVVEMAGLHEKLGSRERAREMYARALPRLSAKRQADVHNSLGILCGELHDLDAQADHYRESARLGGYSAPLFNLALAYHQEGQRLGDALKIVDEAIEMKADPAYLILRSQILKDLGQRDEAQVALGKAIARAEDLDLSEERDFQLGWVRTGAKALGRNDMVMEIDRVRADRRKQGHVVQADDDLPVRDI